MYGWTKSEKKKGSKKSTEYMTGQIKIYLIVFIYLFSYPLLGMHVAYRYY